MKPKFIKQAGTFGPFLQVTPCYAMTYGMHKQFGEHSFQKMFMFYKLGYGACYYSLTQTRKIGDYYLRQVRGDENFIVKEYQDWISDLKELEKQGRALLSGGNDLKVAEFYELYVVLWARSIVCEIYDDDINKRILKLAQEFCVDVAEKEIILLTQPDYVTIQLRFEEELIQALKCNDDTEYLVRKYYFLDTDYFAAHPLDLRKRIAEIKRRGIANEAKRIKELMDKTKAEYKKKLKIIQDKALPPELVRILDFFALLVTWRDVRKKMHQIGGYYLWYYVAENVSFPIKLISYMLVLDFLERKHLQKGYPKVLEKRREGVLVSVDFQGTVKCLYDQKKIDQKIKDLEDINKVVTDFRGNIASGGKARGTVKVIKSAQDFTKMKKRDILVAPMTRPEFLPIMKKALAIITDEGGITCHAAIVSRELGIPCVIGTKIATQVLKDGDMVEVDANHGRIKILK